MIVSYTIKSVGKERKHKELRPKLWSILNNSTCEEKKRGLFFISYQIKTSDTYTGKLSYQYHGKP